ncbi:hypothetical protein FACS1894181_07600 [Bacteroidia bacterium]|nr:hypothetical protein FACS1894181_07600 [Bacteroidia bacterium]
MTDQEREEFLQFMEDFLKRMDDDKDLGKNLLREVGIFDEEGRFTEPYENLSWYFSQIEEKAV